MRTPLDSPSAALVAPDETRLDAASAASFRAKLLAAARGADTLTVDLAGVRYVDCFGLEALLAGVRACPGPTEFLNVGAEVRDFIRRNDLHRTLKLSADSLEAPLPLGERGWG